MYIGIMQFELLIPASGSLKDKRRIVRSIKDRLHREHMVSVAEVGMNDRIDVARLGLSVVSADAKRIGDLLSQVESKLRKQHEAELGDIEREIIAGDSFSRGMPEAGADRTVEQVWSEAELDRIERELGIDTDGTGESAQA